MRIMHTYLQECVPIDFTQPESCGCFLIWLLCRLQGRKDSAR